MPAPRRRAHLKTRIPNAHTERDAGSRAAHPARRGNSRVSPRSSGLGHSSFVGHWDLRLGPLYDAVPVPTTINALTVRDIRFPTSRDHDGSDAVNVDPDYSCAYVVLRTDHPDGHEGHGLTFTTGRGTEVVVAAVKALAPRVVGRTLESIRDDMAGFWRHVTGDTQIRWLGPDKGATHLATAAIVNAVWDLY